MDRCDDRLSIDVAGRGAEEGVYQTLPFANATRLQTEGRCEIVEEADHNPEFEKVIRRDREPGIMDDVRRVSLGEAIRVRGKVLPSFEALEKAVSSEVTPTKCGEQPPKGLITSE